MVLRFVQGLGACAGMVVPRAVVRELHTGTDAARPWSRIDRAVSDALKAPEIQGRVYGFGLVPNHASGPQLEVTQAEHLKKWETPIKASVFKAE